MNNIRLKIIFLIAILLVLFRIDYSKSQPANSLKIVKLKTTVTPRKGNVVFLKKAMEVIITPIDEFNNEIKEIPAGLNINLSLSDEVVEHEQVGNKLIYGKTYLYLTPMKVHNIPGIDVLKVGAFLLDSINGLPNLSTGNFVDVLVKDHIPIPPKVETFTLKSEKTGKDVPSFRPYTCGDLIKEMFLFSWEKSIDSNDAPLKKSFATDSNDTRFWIQDQCKIKYTFKFYEYLNFVFSDNADSNNFIRISAQELSKINKHLRQGTAKSVFANYFIVCEDDVYKYSNPQYADQISSFKKQMEIFEMCPGVVEQISNRVDNIILGQNYPNPFNPKTIIPFEIKNKERVVISLFDVLGIKKAELINKIYSPGRYECEFDAKNFPSGIYFYRMVAGQFIETKKLMIQK